MARDAQPDLDALPVKGGFRLRGTQMSRLETFCDAAFAFALTLLVISFEPPTSMDAMRSALREIPAFVASASLLMMFWWGHHEWSRRFGLEDGPTVVLTCLLVFTVLVYVVPLRFMFGLFFVWIEQVSGLPLGPRGLVLEGAQDLNEIFAVYGVGFLAMAGSLVLLKLHAWGQRVSLRLDAAEAHDALADAGIWGVAALTGGLSALLAAWLPPNPPGIPGWVYMILPVAMPFLAVRADRRRKALTQGT